MLRVFICLLIIGSGFFTASQAMAYGCSFSEGNIFISIPQMAIPADTPDGTILYSSPKITRNLRCEAGTYSTPPRAVNVVTTADFNQLVAMHNGVRFTLHIDNDSIDSQSSRTIAYTSTGFNPAYNKTMSMWYEVKVDSTKGKIPVSGTALSGAFESVYVMLESDYSKPRAVVGVSTPNVTYIPCTMAVSVIPDTINFGNIKSSDLDKGVKFQRKFSTLIQKNKGCTIALSAPFGINMYFEPTSPALNADGSLNLNNGLGLSISDTTGQYVPYNSAWKINDVKVESVLKNNFTANLQKIAGQTLLTGPFSADVVVRIDYF
ncbi:TPA: fimbrial protein [Salmonella enterica subsp. enterica serovar Elisabethville]|nr:fimbrial protein [Salmonella enterica subsp. enterica serovar Elisabethville]